MTSTNELKTHLKKFTVKELKKEVMKVKKQFQVSKLKREDVERVILLYHQDFLHLLKIDKKKKPSVKNIKTNKQQDHIIIYITNLLNKLDERAVGTQTPQFIDEKYTGVTIQKGKSRYIVRSKDWSVLLSTINRKQVQDFLYKLIKIILKIKYIDYIYGKSEY